MAEGREAGEAAAGAEPGGLAAVDVVLELLEAAFHSILFLRELYPPRLFERRRRYGIGVQVARHPELCQYLTDALQAMRPWLLQGAVRAVALVVLTPDSTPAERFVFDIGEDVETDWNATLPEHMERHLRGILLKLNSVDALLQPLPPGCTFAIHVTAREEATADSELQAMPWVLTSPNERELGNPASDDRSTAPLLHPLKRATLGTLGLHVYAEEVVAAKARPI